MAAALIIGGITAGVSLYAAKKAGDAAKTASTQQQQSAQAGLDVQKQMYEQTRQDLAPYREQGGYGLTALSQFLLAPGTPGGRPQASGTPGPGSAIFTPSSPTGRPVPRSGATAPAGLMGGGPMAGAPMTASPGAAPSASAGGPPPGMVAMRSPSGQVGYVPQARVPDALAAGGQVVR